MAAATTANEYFSGEVPRYGRRRAEYIGFVEIVRCSPTAGAAGALAHDPVRIRASAVIRTQVAITGDVQVSVVTRYKPSCTAAVIRVQLIVIHCSPRMTTVPAFAHHPMAPVIAFHGSTDRVSSHVEIAGRVGANA